MSFIAGAYSTTLGGSALGQIEAGLTGRFLSGLDVEICADFARDVRSVHHRTMAGKIQQVPRLPRRHVIGHGGGGRWQSDVQLGELGFSTHGLIPVSLCGICFLKAVLYCNNEKHSSEQ